MTKYNTLNVKLSNSGIKIIIKNKKWYPNDFNAFIKCAWRI